MIAKLFTHNKGHPNVKLSKDEEIFLYALYQKELHGLQIPQAVEEASGGERKIGIGTLYFILHSMENKGFIESRWSDERFEDRGGARCRYYKLTSSGVRALEAIQSFQSNLLSWQPS